MRLIAFQWQPTLVVMFHVKRCHSKRRHFFDQNAMCPDRQAKWPPLNASELSPYLAFLHENSLSLSLRRIGPYHFCAGFIRLPI